MTPGNGLIQFCFRDVVTRKVEESDVDAGVAYLTPQSTAGLKILSTCDGRQVDNGQVLQRYALHLAPLAGVIKIKKSFYPAFQRNACHGQCSSSSLGCTAIRRRNVLFPPFWKCTIPAF